ncbi:hypothetical protein CC1G_01424 [Coprinopsis cinerea okayama7|uniref:Mitochondrial distribution and morphology protein 34 n=1 Tax=Coprinopsis cinerea (strain Okayama-7 / 130 / ATCC MYA-4618 / FGSC 9003) TaxID=240176 RepID=MDM34_COPC7|nr:hypothetical protein CC1G_01424 [Coprinopsis cinerea okayama7\|eukprot:XP_001837512.2 hypothetical protein CC1G_01424 [Coprinopsis cinerea okayama7\
MLAAKQPLVVPMHLRLSHFRLSSYVVLVVSKQKGITIVFKTDPLQNVDINSTFDSIAVIQSFIQREIEGQLRQMFREDLPSIIHRLSQQWVKAKVETPYKKQNQDSLQKAPPPTPTEPVPRPLGISRSRSAGHALETMSTPDLSAPQFDRRRTAASDIHGPAFLRPPLATAPRRPQSTTGISVAGRGSPLSAPPITHPTNSSTSTITSTSTAAEPSTFPDLEHFDPTYGLRPEGLPTKPVFKGFSKLFAPNKGLADLAEEISSQSSSVADGDSDYLSSGSATDEEEYERNSYDFVEWGSTTGPNTTPPEPVVEYETIPAIGGGTITRPRVVHAQSQIQLPPGVSPVASSPSRNVATVLSRTGSGSNGSRSGAVTPGILSRNPSNPYFADRLAALPHIYRPQNISSGPLSAPPIASSSRRPFSLAGGYDGHEDVKMKQRASYAYSVHEEAVYMQHTGGAVNRYPHPYDLERHRYQSESKYDDEDIEDYSDEEDNGRGPHHYHPRAHRTRHEAHDDYFTSRHPSASVPPSSPPRSSARPPSTIKRRLSVSSNTTNRTSFSASSAYKHHHPNHSSLSLDPSSSISNHPGNDKAKIVLRPSLLNNSIHHLSTLSHSNHTLSPYTRSFEHFAVRSGPPRGSGAASAVVKSGSGSGIPTPSTSGAGGGSGMAGGGIGLASGSGGGSLGRAKGLTTTAGIVGLGAATSRLGKTKADVVPKARRKRVFRIGGKKPEDNSNAAPGETDTRNVSREEYGADEIGEGYVEGLGHASGRAGSQMGKRPRPRHRKKPSYAASGTDFDEADMDRYFKSMHDAEEEATPVPRSKDRRP